MYQFEAAEGEARPGCGGTRLRDGMDRDCERLAMAAVGGRQPFAVGTVSSLRQRLCIVGRESGGSA